MLTITEIIALNPEDFNETILEEVYNILIQTKIDEIPRKNLRKLLENTFAVLKFKGEQVSLLQEDQTDSRSIGEVKDESTTERIIQENDTLQRLTNKLETEKNVLKNKMGEMNDEITMLQKRLNDISADSDKDSSDPLSEFDRQKDLLKNINAKNKHIKRLIRDIESLQTQNIEQSKTIIDLEKQMQYLKAQCLEFQNQTVNCQTDQKLLNETINGLTAEITRLEGNITYLEDERDRADFELKDFLLKLEQRARKWRTIIDEKENQLDSLRRKYELLKNDNPKMIIESDDHEKNQFEKLVEAIHERDGLIDELENKLKSMAEEMISSTRIMTKISREREAEISSANKQNRKCCKQIEDSLLASQKRCRELSEILDKTEEDNILKSKQAMEAINTLSAYQKGEDGLQNSLRKINKLQQKLNSRDKQIKALIMELNSFHEISQENIILRKKLNIPEDMTVSTSNLIAKQRNKDKTIERLALKLRASEEIRLQLKLDKNELKKELIKLQQQSPTIKKKDSIDELRSEIYCDNCLKNIQAPSNRDSIIQDVIAEWEEKYSNVVEENENLRVGMHEILEKIREYELSSDHITIDCKILEKLLHALDARSISGWYHPAMRMQNELIAIKERAHALKEQINRTHSNENPGNVECGEQIVSNRSSNESQEIIVEQDIESTSKIMPGTRTVTPTLENLPEATVEDFEAQNIDKEFAKLIGRNRELQVEIETLLSFKFQYSEMLEKFKTSDSDITNYCSSLIEKFTDLEIKFNVQSKKYGFLKEDFDMAVQTYKSTETNNINLIANLKKLINNKKHEINLLKFAEKKVEQKIESDEVIMLKMQCAQLNSRLADLISKIFKTKLNETGMEEICADFGLVKENMQLDFLTFEEYQNLKNTNENLKHSYEEVNLKNKNLEESLQIAQEQVKAEQKLLGEITDNQIELRHLVADLQSNNEDKFLISKSHRNLELAKIEIAKMKSERESLERQIQILQNNLDERESELKTAKEDLNFQNSNNLFTIKFLKSFIYNQQEKYCKYTPLLYLKDFVVAYLNFLKIVEEEKQNNNKLQERIDKILFEKLKNVAGSEDLIKLVKVEMKCKLLEEQLSGTQQKLESTQKDFDTFRIAVMQDNEQWQTIQILFNDKKRMESVETATKAMQTNKLEMINSSTNTDEPKEEIQMEAIQSSSPKSSPIKTLTHQESDVKDQPSLSSSMDMCTEHAIQIKTLQCQLDKAISLASERSILLLGIENKLAEAHGKARDMEKTISTQREQLGQSEGGTQSIAKSPNVNIETTVNYLQSLITQKDATLLHYQELLKTEKEQHLKSCETYDKQITSFKKLQEDLERTIEMKNYEINELKGTKVSLDKAQALVRPGPSEQTNSKAENTQRDNEILNENLDEISDEKIEEMFMDVDEGSNVQECTEPDVDIQSLPFKENKDIQLKEIKNRLIFWEKSVKSKDEEIILLKEKLKLLQDRVEPTENSEIEQLRILLEEKDKHINDLMETLTSFHDDQQRFLTETSLYSADQVTQLGTNLSRSETANKILQTQLEALKRQLASLGQREKQARDLANSLKTQLIKRPVVPLKTEFNTRIKSEHQQKVISQLESELRDAKLEIAAQKKIIDEKRARNVSEVNLWEKQKQHQQTAEKLKIKLDETEKSLEKCRSLLNGARNTITRLEKDKSLAEHKFQKGEFQKGVLTKCCRTPSCPNLFSNKFNSPESQDKFTGLSSQRSDRLLTPESAEIIINKLKHRIEAQQRRIYAYEIYGKGKNVMTLEMEKLQEKLSAAEAQNIRWEAKNLQLQLDIDLLRQEDENERLNKRIKHLEDYVVALKEELAKAAAQKELSTEYRRPSQQENTEQTILALKRIVERLKAENKHLKDGRITSNLDGRNRIGSSTEMAKLQQSYSEAVKKISTLQIELQLKQTNDKDLGGGDFMNEFKFIKEQLIKKTQLLEKAKILLTRAAAKEKSLKEQLSIWKRKCSELQNVPVIEEISE